MSRRRAVFAAGITFVALMLTTIVGASPALGARDRSAPTTPGNLRITALTPYTVSLAWDASKDNSGIASYTICCAHTNRETVSGTATTHTYTKGLEAGRQFSLIVVAIDNAGN